MVRFVDVAGMSRWVAETGVESIVRGMAQYLAADFARWEQFDKSPRVANHSSVGVIELMPISDNDTYAFKYVNGHPANPAAGFQTVTAFGVLADTRTGYPVFWSEMTILTALRTAATSVLAARALARPESGVMAMIGAGTQSEFQALAFRAVLGITRLRVFDTDPSALNKFERNLAPLGFEIVRAESAADAALGADIITTCTADKANAIVLSRADIAPGVHINALGGDCPGKTELDAAILRDSTVFVEYPPQTRVEGEIQQLEGDFPVTELWKVLTGQSAGRIFADQITVFDSVGFAIEDFSALRYLRDQVAGTSYAQDVDLIAEPNDPKDLFSLVAAASTVAA